MWTPNISPVAASELAPSSETEQVPFDRAGRGYGITPSSAVIPPGARIPAGTPISIRLQSAIGSTSAQAGDVFQALLVEPIVVNGQTFAETGTSVTGREDMEARPRHSSTPGYLRLALKSISIKGKPSAVRSSSNFLKGPSPLKRMAARIGQGPVAVLGAGDGRAVASLDTSDPASAGDVTVGLDRRLTFRLTEPLPLPNNSPQPTQG